MFKPIIVTLQQEFNCSAAKAFDVAQDLERRPEWIDFIEKSYYIEKTPNVLGSRYKEKLEFLGFDLYLEYEIKEFVQDRLIISQCKMAPFKPLVTIYCQPIHENKIKGGMEIQLSPGPLALLPRKFVIKEIENLIEPLIDKFRSLVEE